MGRNINDLRPDGHGWRARLGVLSHDDSAISESELWTMAPDGVSLHTSRIFFADLATFADPPGPENAAQLLARLPLQAIIYEWVRGHVPSSAQAVFIGGNALRAIGVIAALEEDLHRPVLTANQVSLWYALRVAGAEVRVDDYGQLFQMPSR